MQLPSALHAEAFLPKLIGFTFGFTLGCELGAQSHSDYSRIGGRPVSCWLTSPGETAELPKALQTPERIRRGESPKQSRVWHLLTDEQAPLFGVFDGHERQLRDWPAAEAFAVDINDLALRCTTLNARRAGAGFITPRQSVLPDGVDGNLDLIVANIPYRLNALR